MSARLLHRLIVLFRQARRRAEQLFVPGAVAGFTEAAIEAARWLH